MTPSPRRPRRRERGRGPGESHRAWVGGRLVWPYLQQTVGTHLGPPLTSGEWPPRVIWLFLDACSQVLFKELVHYKKEIL